MGVCDIRGIRWRHNLLSCIAIKKPYANPRMAPSFLLENTVCRCLGWLVLSFGRIWMASTGILVLCGTRCNDCVAWGAVTPRSWEWSWRQRQWTFRALIVANSAKPAAFRQSPWRGGQNEGEAVFPYCTRYIIIRVTNYLRFVEEISKLYCIIHWIYPMILHSKRLCIRPVKDQMSYGSIATP